jgi:hypothetical protein
MTTLKLQLRKSERETLGGRTARSSAMENFDRAVAKSRHRAQALQHAAPWVEPVGLTSLRHMPRKNAAAHLRSDCLLGGGNAPAADVAPRVLHGKLPLATPISATEAQLITLGQGRTDAY